MVITYEDLRDQLKSCLDGLSALAGDTVGESNTWQGEAQATARDLETLAQMLRSAAHGNGESFLTFPSPAEIL